MIEAHLEASDGVQHVLELSSEAQGSNGNASNEAESVQGPGQQVFGHHCLLEVVRQVGVRVFGWLVD